MRHAARDGGATKNVILVCRCLSRIPAPLLRDARAVRPGRSSYALANVTLHDVINGRTLHARGIATCISRICYEGVVDEIGSNRTSGNQTGTPSVPEGKRVVMDVVALDLQSRRNPCGWIIIAPTRAIAGRLRLKFHRYTPNMSEGVVRDHVPTGASRISVSSERFPSNMHAVAGNPVKCIITDRGLIQSAEGQRTRSPAILTRAIGAVLGWRIRIAGASPTPDVQKRIVRDIGTDDARTGQGDGAARTVSAPDVLYCVVRENEVAVAVSSAERYPAAVDR